jgi:tetratricopeptide (TPR) repeat protein
MNHGTFRESIWSVRVDFPPGVTISHCHDWTPDPGPLYLFDKVAISTQCNNLERLQTVTDDGRNKGDEDPGDLQRNMERDVSLIALHAEINRISLKLSEKSPDESPAHAQLAYYLGALHNMVFARMQTDTALDEAIRVYRHSMSLLPQDHGLRFHLLVDLGNVLHHRYRLAKRLQDIEESIQAFRTALAMCTEDHPRRPYILDSLGCTIDDRSKRMLDLFHYQKAKSLTCLETAIEGYKELVGLFASQDRRRYIWLHRMSDILRVQYDHTGDAATMKEMVNLCDEAVSLVPVGDPRRPRALLQQAIALYSQLDPDNRALAIVALPAVDVIIHVLEECASLYLMENDGADPNYVSTLTFLAHTVKARASITGSRHDWEQSISIHKQALEACPTGHPQRHQSLYAIAQVILEPSAYHPSPEDVALAKTSALESLELMQGGHPARFMAHYCLCYVQLREGDDDAAIDHLYRMATDDLGNVRERMVLSFTLLSTLRKSVLAEGRLTPASADTLLGIYRHLLRMPPCMAFRAVRIQSRLQQVSTWEALGRDAAVVALEIGQPHLALECLEAGRAGFWSQSLHLRSDFDRLPPEMSRELAQLSRALEQASFDDDNDGTDAGSSSAAAKRHMSQRFDEIVADARQLPGLEQFMAGETAAELVAAAATVRIVVLVPGQDGICHAITVGIGGALGHVPLPGMTTDGLSKLGLEMKEDQMAYRAELSSRQGVSDTRLNLVKNARRPRTKGSRILTQLWDAVAKPVLDSFGLEVSQRVLTSEMVWLTPGMF